MGAPKKNAVAPAPSFDGAAYCKCGCQRRDHVHSSQVTQHTPMKADAPRDCLGRCLGHYEGPVWSHCEAFTEGPRKAGLEARHE